MSQSTQKRLLIRIPFWETVCISRIYYFGDEAFHSAYNTFSLIWLGMNGPMYVGCSFIG